MNAVSIALLCSLLNFHDQEHLGKGMDGVMVGRGVSDSPFMLSSVDSRIFGDEDAFAGLTP
jgi:tRNA-dihydrouridine synthase